MKSFCYFLFIVLVFELVGACDSGSEVPADDTRAYYPLRKGLYQIYDVERTEYVLGNPTTIIYQLKTVVVDSFLNPQNNYTYVLHRSLRYNESDAWQYIDTWSVRTAMNETVLQLENLSVVTLQYPVRAALAWNSNVYNTLEKNIFSIESFRTEELIGENSFDDCVTIRQADNDDYIVFLDQRKEIYARNVGLVYKDSTALQYCTQNDCLGLQQVEQGVVYKQIIRSYGVE